MASGPGSFGWVFKIKPPQEEDRAAIARVEALAFNDEPRPGAVGLGGKLCAYEDDLLVGVATAIPLGQWFGGRRTSCSGVSGVAVAPEHRGRGVASRLMIELLRQEHQAGRALSVLYPANSALYRKLGYEFGGARPELAVPIADVPAGRGLPVSEAGGGQVPQLMKLFSHFASGHNGPVETDSPAFFVNRSLAHAGEGAHQRTVVVEGPNGLEGYASYFTGEGERAGRYRITCKHLVANTPAAFSSLLSYFRRFENSARTLAWYGPVGSAPMGLALSTNGFTMESNLVRWMTRVLDVPAALQSRGYAAVDGEVVIEVDDPLFPGNRGPWSVSATSGKVNVERATGTGKPLSINAFSALYTGYATPNDLVLAGMAESGDPRLGFLGELFAGPAPWMPDFF